MGKVPTLFGAVMAADVAELCQAFRLGEQGSRLAVIEADGWLSFLFDGAPAAKSRELT